MNRCVFVRVYSQFLEAILFEEGLVDAINSSTSRKDLVNKVFMRTEHIPLSTEIFSMNAAKLSVCMDGRHYTFVRRKVGDNLEVSESTVTHARGDSSKQTLEYEHQDCASEEEVQFPTSPATRASSSSTDEG